MNIEWDAEAYASKFSFVPAYGADVLSLVDEGDGTGLAVDLGCGAGALTAGLAARGYRVLGVDDSPEMLARARAAHPELEFRRGDAVTFALEEPADVIFSNAVFHWIDADRQQALACNLFSQLKPGGVLVAEFGGAGCAEAVHAALEASFAQRGLPYLRTFWFPTIGQYAPLLERAGFRVEYATLFDRPTPQGEGGLTGWIEMFLRMPFEGMAPQLKREILGEVEERLRPWLYRDGCWYIDYVRIRVKAVRPALSNRAFSQRA